MSHRIDALKAQLREELFLDMDDYVLEEHGEEVVSGYLGLQLNSAFQPIFDAAANATLGFEALLRPSIAGAHQVSPQLAFSFAESLGSLVKFDRICRTLHMLNYLNMPNGKGQLFLNVHPKLLISVNAHGKVFERILHAHSIPTHEVVIEILESSVEKNRQLAEAIENYRDRGYRIAIDDFGRDHSNLERLWQHAPEFVKLDMSIIQQAQKNSKVRNILPKLVEMILGLGAQPIIEGIETREQYDIAKNAGADLLQGYFLGRPFSAVSWRNADKTEASGPAA